MQSKEKWRWAVVLLLECAGMAFASALAALSEWLPAGICTVCQWLVYPLAAAVAACIATRKGVNNYAAWLPGPVMYPVVYWLIWDYLSSAGPMFLSALTAIVGAALGETVNQFERRQRK